MDFRRKRRNGITEINLTPLIDVVFLLLLFFLITSTFAGENPGIQVELPKANAQSVQGESENILVTVTEEGRFLFESRAVSGEELKTELTTRRQQAKDAVVIVQADTKTNHGKVVEVMDIAKQVGFNQLAIATTNP